MLFSCLFFFLCSESDAPSDYSLFEALRDSIYSEVATLISQNESRPHFLVRVSPPPSVHGRVSAQRTSNLG